MHSEDIWNEINNLEIFYNVASALVPVGPPQYMTDIALAPEKYLANAVYSLSRSDTCWFIACTFSYYIILDLLPIPGHYCSLQFHYYYYYDIC